MGKWGKGEEMKYIKTDFYNEYIEFEHDGKEYSEDLYLTSDNGSEMRGCFNFNGKTYFLHKYLSLEPGKGTTLTIEIK